MKFRTLAALAGAAAATTLSLSAQAALVYSNLPATTPPNVPSLGYQATSTSEFGDHVQLAAGGRGLNTVTVMMSSWALASDYGSSDPGFEHDLSFSLYNYTGDAAAGSLIAAKTITTVVPWRPAADPTCPGGTGWRAGDGNCYNGYAFNVVFDFSADGIVLPDELVFGLSFNAQSYGDNPTGTQGGFNSLNFGLVAAAPSVGTDVDPDSVFWNTSHQPFLTSGTAGVFGADSAWAGYVPAVAIDTQDVPEPATLALVALALVGAGAASKRRRQA